MVTILCETVSFQGKGSYTCRQCWTVLDLPHGISAVLMALPGARLLFDASTGDLVHDCTKGI